ncbi:MAG TPA: hypothetical protein VMH41_16750 [Mycobacteriales bacterium]|nr:hypothetical protein [Mycobacteriales bacterium]
MADFVEIVGLEKLLGVLDPATWAAGASAGLLKAGQTAIESRARANVEDEHHFTGNLAQNLHTEVQGSGLDLEAHVGVSTGLVPEGRPLEFGWPAGSGKQPPTDAIARWLASKPEIAGSPLVTRSSAGFIRRKGTIAQISQDAAIRSRAFLIARAIGQRGYSFGALHWLSQAGADGAEDAAQIVQESITDALRQAAA